MRSEEEEVISGNIYNKYESKNIIVRVLMSGYFNAFNGLLDELQPRNILELGCGEGYLIHHLEGNYSFAKCVGIDISHLIIKQAAERCGGAYFTCGSAYELPFACASFDLVLCMEVLEHLQEPRVVLEEITRICSRFILLSVPREPIWRMLNLARGAYIRDFGNTPGHLNHWTKREFIALLKDYFTVMQTATPLPWTMALCTLL